ncbi:SagB-type dehydrogenase family enzyme [Tumebacillus sp. BK434]|uniref:SagB/ThcOx family dehydrogenase n=1 Tax=Tumebacillus sp. BK434 TaxID=2512169 RepID=UPI00104BBA0D|nr:SagB/ThcOx family dehydrogenase [Tumebacillus sp. BK434]TCP53361.1 SagB-type dehydrogenase family enzyme [Tumebacillus sp. BK434]
MKLEIIRDYHEQTKHHFHRHARALAQLDWDTQPDPFRTYLGAVQIPLLKVGPTAEPRYDEAYAAGRIAPAPLNLQGISQLFYDSMSIARWKMSLDGTQKRAVRINPSSGNLHPTEAYLLCGAVAGVSDAPLVAHYSPQVHALEKRAEVPFHLWQRLSRGLPDGGVLVGLTSIYWRESWKYGERAFRYCHLDVGHALGALAVAAAGLGWQVRLVEAPGTGQLNTLLGVAGQDGPEAEHADCLLAVWPAGCELPVEVVDPSVMEEFAGLNWLGERNVLSRDHHPWEIIDTASQAAVKPETQETPRRVFKTNSERSGSRPAEMREISLRSLVRKRRSAVGMDGTTGISREVFYHILQRLAAPAFDVLPWEPKMSMVVFVHRVAGLTPGMYALVRNPEHVQSLKSAAHASFLWTKPETCPEGLDFYLLTTGDFRKIARDGSCDQDIASDGSFAVAMYAEFDRPLEEQGAWFYPRLHWECGLAGQVLYLEAEAAGVSGTGIGCFFDNPMHRTLGLKGRQWQDLYHFTVGGALEDRRLTDLPTYGE